MAEIRRKNLIRTISATGRNFLYYKADLENFIYDHSPVGKRRKNDAKNVEDGNTKKIDVGKRNKIVP